MRSPYQHARQVRRHPTQRWLMFISIVLGLTIASASCRTDAEVLGPNASAAGSGQASDLELTYVCGNTFSVRNASADTVVVTWDVPGRGETGQLSLPPKPGDSEYSETYFTIVNRGPVRLFLGGRLIQTKANTGKPPCVVPGSEWPEVRGGLEIHASLDTALVVGQTGAEDILFFRTVAILWFVPDRSDSAKSAYLTRHSLTVLGATPSGQFFVQFADPGPDFAAFIAILDSLRATPEADIVASISRTPLEPSTYARYPHDGPGSARVDWANASQATWASRAIRAPLAWGCETGTYGGPLVGVGVIEYKHPVGHSEFAASAPRLWEPSDSVLKALNDSAASVETVDSRLLHAMQVTGVLTASGGDSAGVAGTIWRTRLHQYSIYSSGDRQLPFRTGFFAMAMAIAQDDVRVLSISSDQSFTPAFDKNEQEEDIRALARSLRSDLLIRSPNLLIVVGAGNERYRGTVTDYVRAPGAAALRAALLLLREDPAYRDRIIVVTGTSDGNRFWDGVQSFGSSFFSNATDLAAPAEDVRVLDRWTGQTGPSIPVTTATGTSLSAPHVAGVAAQLLSMDPTLTPAQVKDYILRGAMEPRVDSTTGAVIDPVQRRLTGAPQPIYQLDAYGAVTLLARERPATPICGFGVSVAADNNAVLLHRDSALAPEAIPAPADRRIWDVSVAQGGRLLSVDVSGGIGLYEHSNGGWIAAPVRADYESRIFLERDTAYIRYDRTSWSPVTLVTLRGPGGNVTDKDVFSGLFGGPYGRGRLVARGFSVTGDWVVGEAEWGFDDFGCDHQVGYVTYLIPLRGGSAVPVMSSARPACKWVAGWYQSYGSVAWGSDGAEAWIVLPETRISVYYHPDDTEMEWPLPNREEFRTRFLPADFRSGVQFGTAVIIPDWNVHAASWKPDGSIVQTRERNESPTVEPPYPCISSLRPARQPASVISSRLVPDAECYDPLPMRSNRIMAGGSSTPSLNIARSSRFADAAPPIANVQPAVAPARAAGGRLRVN